MLRVLNKFSEDQKPATQRYSQKKVIWKYAVNLQGNTHAEVQFQ